MKKIALASFAIAALGFTGSASGTAIVKSGCCSWHGGVSHCDTAVGTYVCNDGTYSPTCGCERVNRFLTPAATPVSSNRFLGTSAVATRMKGKFLLQVEDRGRIWWVNPDTSKRIELTPDNFYSIIRQYAVGITNQNLEKIAE